AGKLSFTLLGKKLRGSFALVKTKYGPETWLLLKHRDEHASERDVLLDDRSVRSGLTIGDLKEGRLPNPGATAVEAHAGARAAPFPDARKERPMLATLVDVAFDAPGWLWEPKLDGVRMLAFIRDGKAELRSRRGVDVTKQYPSLVASLAAQPAATMVLDGEVCALDEAGVPRFQLLQPRINLTRGVDAAKVDAELPVVYFVFDLLYLDGYDLRAVPLRERKALLQSRLLPKGDLRVVSHVEEHGRDLEAGARRLGFEGVVGKRADSRYEPGVRSRAWLKVKAVREQEFVVGGYTAGEGARRATFGALALGCYDDGKLRYAGNVGSGFDERELAAVIERLKALSTEAPPFADAERVQGQARWVRPELVAAVKFAEWTQDGRLRAPVFLGLRDDIDPKQVRREVASATAWLATEDVNGAAASPRTGAAEVAAVVDQLANPKANFTIRVAGEEIKLTNLDKVFWPPFGEAPPLYKRDLVEYYVKVAPYLLPHLRDRPLTLTRYPNGVTARPFYQKHYAQPIPDFVETVTIWSEHTRSDGEYILCNNLPTLVWLAQIADLELHAWMSRVDPEPDAHGRGRDFAGSEAAMDASALNYPDFMIFDLDPYIYSGNEGDGEEPEFNKRGWEKTVVVALSLKDMLDQLRLSSFVKTSGKTGLHVYVPILRHYDFDDVRAATQTIGRFLMQQQPKDVTLEWDTSKRRGKVFFDANQNTRGKTLAAQYSLRPTAWAGVSTPIAWSELAKLDPTSLNLRTVPERLAQRGDTWSDILSRKNDLAALISA
ncbi:MAG TPA: DNA ligase D, partial [Dehalococcoidia bacterium]